MLPKDRILAVFEHRPTDKVPIYQSGFSSRAASHILGREAYVGGGIQLWRESKALWAGADAHREFLERSIRDALEVSEILDLDLARSEYWRQTERPAKKLDEHTFLYGDPSASWRLMRLDPRTELYQVVEQSEQAVLTLEGLDAVVAAEERALEEYAPTEADFASVSEGMKLFGFKRAVLAGGISLKLPYQETAWLEAALLRPDLVARTFEVQVQKALRNIPVVAKTGTRFIAGGGDCASNKGTFYSSEIFHELALPALRRISDACHAHDLFHMFGSDGNLWAFADDLFGASGVDCLYEADRRAGMDLRRLRERFPNLSILGGISSHTLHVGSRQEVIAETLSAIEEAKRSGGIVVGASNQIVADTPPENLFAMIETIRRNR